MIVKSECNGTLALYSYLMGGTVCWSYPRLGASLTRLPRLDVRLQEEDDEQSSGLILLPDDLTCDIFDNLTCADSPSRYMLASYCPTCRQTAAPLCLRLISLLRSSAASISTMPKVLIRNGTFRLPYALEHKEVSAADQRPRPGGLLGERKERI